MRQWRERISAGKILTRLRDHTLADEDIMSPSQVAAAKILLAKCLPDIKQIEHSGPGGQAMPMISVSFLDQAPDPAAIEHQGEDKKELRLGNTVLRLDDSDG